MRSLPSPEGMPRRRRLHSSSNRPAGRQMRQGNAPGGWERGDTMNPAERVARRLDEAQQRHTLPAFVVAVVKKYTDDNGGVEAAAPGHPPLFLIFPVLLALGPNPLLGPAAPTGPRGTG